MSRGLTWLAFSWRVWHFLWSNRGVSTAWGGNLTHKQTRKWFNGAPCCSLARLHEFAARNANLLLLIQKREETNILRHYN